jgi:hypothetical protein
MMNPIPESESSNPTSEKLKAIAIVVVCLMIVLVAFSFPFIRDGYRLKTFTQNIELGMPRAGILKIAEAIGYSHKDIESRDGIIILNHGKFEPGEMGEIFYFKNILLDSAFAVKYDPDGKVSKIRVDT